MRRLWLLALLLAGCAPTLAPTLERAGSEVTITVAANAPAYNVTLSVLDAVTNDERCGVIGSDFGCVLGDIAPGESVTVTGEARGKVSCVAFGLSQAGRIDSYRPYACRVIGGGS